MKKIIIPTDFSDFSLNALEYGVNLFSDEEVIFYFVHAFGVPNGAAMAVKNLDTILRDEAERSFENFLPKLKVLLKSNHTVKSRIINASLIESVKDVERKEKINFILMGTAGATGIKEIFFGSNASDAAANTKAPLITIPVNYKYSGLSTVIVATDNKPFEVFEGFENVKNLLIANNTEIKTLYVNARNEKNNSPQGNVCSNVFSGLKCSAITVQAPSAASGIRNYANETSPDLVILIARKHSFWERLSKRSVTEKIVESLKKPILIMHE